MIYLIANAYVRNCYIAKDSDKNSDKGSGKDSEKNSKASELVIYDNL